MTKEPMSVETSEDPSASLADPLAEPAGPAVAVVGMSCRFPDAADTRAFWRNLRDGVESVRAFTPEELAAAGVSPAILAYPGFVNVGAVLDGVDLFDASFFGYSARDAELLDPQHRIFLEECWRALEDAGCDAATTDGLIGVFAGVDMSRYMFNLFSNQEILASAGFLQILLANDKDHLTTRVSYKLNLRGPAVTVQTTCSTALVAVCQACQGLLTYQCDAALAGGSSISLPQAAGYVYHEGGTASPDGRCRAFDAAANGTAGGNGVGAVLLMRLEDAVAGGYPVRAVIRGFGLSNDGSGKVGYTAPGIEGQAEAITTAQGVAGVDPETITYIEAHGTATPIGDPIEVAALNRVFSSRTSKRGFCGLGSVKTNIGHLNAAAGVAGLIKTVLALEHRQLPPSLHFRVPNPKLRLDGSPFYVVDRLQDWPANGSPRRAGVSAFGIGGTNAHVVLEEAPAPAPRGPSRPWQLLVLSARTASALDKATANLAVHLRENPELALADVAFTLQAGRQAFEHRRALVVPGDGVEAACRALETGEGVLTTWRQGGSRPVALLFPGQGAQHAGMGAEVYGAEQVYREQLDRCAELLVPHLGLDLRAVLHPAPGEEPAATERLARTDIAQPALFAVEYSLARLWESWGVHPEAMLGHSLGEYVAACLAGVFSLEDALALVAARGRLMQGMPEGAMLAVHLPEAEVLPLLHPALSLAAVNGPALCVVSGPPTAVQELEAQLAARDVSVRRLHTAQAFHSADVDALIETFEEEVARTAFSAPQIPFLSNVTGTWITPSQAIDPAYWSSHMRRTVRFGDGLRLLLAEPDLALLEAGPGRPLASLALAQGGPEGTAVISSLPHPQDRRPEPEVLLEGLGRLWLAGARIDWRGFAAGERRCRIALPTYPFERQRYWVDPVPSAPAAAGEAATAPRRQLDQWFYRPVWQEVRRDSAARPGGQRLHWLLFADGAGLAEPLATRLAEEGHEVMLVRPGAGFGRLSERELTLDPLKPAGYAALFKELRSRRWMPDRLVHLWSVTGPEAAASAADEIQSLSFYSLVFLAQAVTEQLGAHPVQLTVVANRAFEVRDGDAVEPVKAMGAGACLVIAQELPALACRFLDLDLGEEGAPGWLLEELAAGRDEILVALRGQQRLARRFEPVQLAQPAAAARLRERGVYLITGGLGGIGLTVARRLAERVRARLLLLTRSFPPREQWDDPSLPLDVARKVRQLREIEALGAEVEVVQGDVVRREDVERVARLAADRFGGLHGIVHSAGVAGGGLIQLKTFARASQVLAPKVAGTLILDQVFAGAELDFFILCSSLASVLGGPGQVDYCAANAFLDGFAARERARGGRLTVAVNWDTWAEVGMAVNTAMPSDLETLRRESLRQGITPPEGADAFERILASGLSQVAVSTSDLPARIRQWASQGDAVVPPPAPRPPARHRRPELAVPYRAPRNETERIIAEIWQELLGVEPVGADDRFLDLGGHSLLAGQVVSRLRVTLQVDLSIRTVFEASTLAELAQLVELEMQGEENPLEEFEPLPSPFGFARVSEGNPGGAE